MGELSIKPFPGLDVKGKFEYNTISLVGGSFNTNLYRLILGIYPSPRTAFYGNLQYDDVSNLVGLYAKLHHTIRPGSDFYLVYTHNWQRFGQGLLNLDFETISRESSVKVNYTHRF